MLLVPTASALAHLEVLRAAWQNATVAVPYVNDHSPAAGDTAEDYAAAAFGGAGARTLTWPDPAFTDSQGDAQVLGPILMWTVTGPPLDETVFGYFVLDAAGLLLWAERAPAPTPMNAVGVAWAVLPQFVLHYLVDRDIESGQGGVRVGGQGVEVPPAAVEVGQGGVRVGGLAVEVLVPVEVGQGGVRVGGLAVEVFDPVEVAAGGVRVGGQGVEVLVAVEVGQGGVRVGGQAVEVLVAVEVAAGGVRVGGQAVEVAVPGESSLGGFALGGVALEVLESVESGQGGGALGGKAVEVVEAVEVGQGGVRVGGQGVEALVAAEVGQGGVRVGGQGAEAIGMKGELLALLTIDTDETTSSNVQATLATPDQFSPVTVNPPGDIMIEFECDTYNSVAVSNHEIWLYNGANLLSTSVVTADGVNYKMSMRVRGRVPAVAATGVIEVTMATSAGTAHFLNRTLRIIRTT